MSSCEKCWQDAGGPVRYLELLYSRNGHPCSVEEQAGHDATQCPVCGKMSVHQYTRELMCKCKTEPTP